MNYLKVPPHSIEAEKSVLGAILLDKEVILDVANIIKPLDFYKEIHKEIYECILDLYNKNIEIDLINLSEKLKIKQTLESIGGITYLTELMDYVPTTLNVKSYAKIVKEKSVRRQVIKSAIDIQNKAYEAEYENEIDIKSDALEVLSSVEVNDTTKTKTLKNILKEIKNDITRKRNQDSNTDEKYYTGLADYDYWLDGLHEQEFTIIGARPSWGKEQPLYSKILTPNGWITMGEVKVGDKVIGSNGKPCNVTGVFPQGEKDIYRVYFNDQTYTDCGLEHLWLTKNRNERKSNKPATVKTTKEIMESLKVGNGERYNHSISYVAPIEFEKKELLIHPYLLGVYLGDGYCSSNSNAMFSNIEEDIINKIKLLLPESDMLKCLGNNKDYRVMRKQRNNNISTFKNMLFNLGLVDSKSYDKFIPDIYLYGSVEQRVELLRGLLDTDGYVENKGKIEFSTASEKLKDGVCQLVRSLGGKCYFYERIGAYIKDKVRHNTRKNYRVYISFTNNIIPVSSIKHIKKYNNMNIRKKDKFITDIVFIGKYEAQCIMVDSLDHLYVTDDYILTHNTALAFQIAMHFAKKGLNTVFDTLEMSDQQVIYRMLASELNINSHKLRKPKMMTQEEFDKILKDTYLENLPLHIEEIRYIQDLRAYCRMMKQKNKLDVLFIDYLQLMQTMKSTGTRNEELGDISRNLKSISKEFNIPVVALAQLNRSLEREGREPRLSDLRECGDIEQDADNVLFLHKPSDVDDLSEIQDRKIIIAKQRNGATGYFNLLFEGKTFKFKSIAKEPVYTSRNTRNEEL